MKKCVIIAPAYPLRGGIASSTERLAYELQDHGYTVTIYTFKLQYPAILFPGKTQYSEDPPPENLNIKVEVNSINPLNWWRVGRAISRQRPDLVVTRFWIPFMGPSLGTILRLIGRNNQTKRIAIVDNMIPHERRPGDRSLSRYFIGSVDAFIVMSKAVGEQIRLFDQQRPISVVPHPIYDNYGELVSREAALTELGLDPAYRYLLFFGFIRDYKGLDLLLEAMADPRIRALPLRLIVAGEYYGGEDNYKRQIDRLGIREQLVLHTRFISNEAVRFYFCASDLVVQPYKTATQSGISQLAYFFEKPMVATAVGGLPEIIAHGEAGYVVPVDPAPIADAIIDFFTENREAAFVARVKQEKQRYSWSNMVKGLEKLMAQIQSK